MKKLLIVLASLVVATSLTPVSAAERDRWHTRVFASVPYPGYPAYAFSHPNGRVYAGTYSNPRGDSARSRVFEWSGDGTLLRSWTVPGQHLDEERGVQVANADAHGRLVLLEKSTSRVMTLNVRTGRFRTHARIPDLPNCSASPDGPCSPSVVDSPGIPNYATWGPRGELYVSDYGQAVVWKLPAGGGKPRPWFTSPALDGSEFGTTGLVLRPARRDLLIAQGSTATDGSVPTNGKLYRLPIRDGGRPGTLRTLWTSRPGELPDGFGIARSGRIYLANAGVSGQLVVLAADGDELERFPEEPLSGENGSAVPFDTPSSATFHHQRVLVANQSFTGDASHHVILDVAVGERGRRPYVPGTAFWG